MRKFDPLAVLEPGDLVPTIDAPLIDFAGRKFYVRAFAGQKTEGCMIVTAELDRPMGPVDFIDMFLASATNLMVTATDWEKIDPNTAAIEFARTVIEQFQDVYSQHMQMLAARKPS